MKAETMQGGSSNGSVSPRGAKIKTCLPDDIVSQEIFLRLPVKSLLRFRSVNKQWLSWISDPNFIRSHLKHVSSSHHHKKLMILSQKAPQLHSIDHESALATEKFDIPYYRGGEYEYILGSCNGLLCIGIVPGANVVSAIVCNPLLNMYKEVINLCDPPHLVGFGYDSISDDYKVVSVEFRRIHDHSVPHLLVNVCTLKTNLTRSFPVEPRVPVKPRGCNQVGTLFNASLYWIIGTGISNMLIRFDLRYEKFKLIELPALDIEKSLAMLKIKLIVDQNGCFCIFEEDLNNTCLTIWIMKEEKEDEYNSVISWIKGSKIQLPHGFSLYWPLFVTSNGALLMQVVKDNGPYELILYNPHKDEDTEKIIPLPGIGHWYGDANYLQTLVQPS